jgi:hypothetical protein
METSWKLPVEDKDTSLGDSIKMDLRKVVRLEI